MSLKLELMKGQYGICRLDTKDTIPTWCQKGEFYSITKTADELSIVCLEDYIPNEIQAEKEWRIFKILGPLDFSLVGILSKISTLLAESKMSIFALSTYDTDYILVKQSTTLEAINQLRQAGYHVIEA